jgi:hypothetical protein
MSETKEKLIQFIIEDDISSIQIMSRRLGITEDDVRELLDELSGDGILIGYISKDGQRFFRHDLKQPRKESKATDDYVPEYVKFDTRPGIIISIVGIIILIVSAFFYTSTDLGLIFISSITMLLGVSIFLIGCYCISMKRSPI